MRERLKQESETEGRREHQISEGGNRWGTCLPVPRADRQGFGQSVLVAASFPTPSILTFRNVWLGPALFVLLPQKIMSAEVAHGVLVVALALLKLVLLVLRDFGVHFGTPNYDICLFLSLR